MKRILTLVLAVLLTVSLLVSCQGAKTAKDFTIIEENFGEEFYGIGFRKGDNALTLAIQETLDAMIADGKFAEISNKWFGKDVAVANAAFPRAIEEVEGDTSLDYILNKGELILGLDETFPPMGYRDANGDIVGFDIDLATEVCARLGIKLKLQPIDWNSKEMELDGYKIDCIWNGLSVTEERLGAMFMPKAYISNTQVVIVPEGSNIKALADLEGKTVGLQEGSSSLDALSANPIKDKVKEIIEYPNNVNVYMDLQAGRIEAFVVDEVVGRYLIVTDGAEG